MALIEPATLLKKLIAAATTEQIEAILTELPIVPTEEYSWTSNGPSAPWRDGLLHWIPIGKDRGNAGRIDLAGEPMNPLAERLINGMEAQIELARQIELKANPEAKPPTNPRDAVQRYWGIGRLDRIETLDDDARRDMRERADKVRDNLALRYQHSKSTKEHTVRIQDRGIGQAPEAIHETLLSLGRSSKGDKGYLIGLFGQGGSSTYSAANYSVVVSRRAPSVLKPDEDAGAGWSIVRCIRPKGRRDKYYAYLAAREDGQVPRVNAAAADAAGFQQGTLFSHIAYDFGGVPSAVSRALYQSLNHVLFNPPLPWALYAQKDTPEPMFGTAHRLARKVRLSKSDEALDRTFEQQPIS